MVRFFACDVLLRLSNRGHSDLKAANAISFKSFADLPIGPESSHEVNRTLEGRKQHIGELLHLGKYDEARRHSEALRDVSLAGLEYLQKCLPFSPSAAML
jgi:hypothetical protein